MWPQKDGDGHKQIYVNPPHTYRHTHKIHPPSLLSVVYRKDPSCDLMMRESNGLHS